MTTIDRRYPLGKQTFSDVIEEHCLYIDKTEYVYKLTHDQNKYMFLSRPRRFGKSLLCSTLKSYFEGKRTLFKGLAIEKLEKDWITYPVLHFNMADGKYMDKTNLSLYLDSLLREYEYQYGRDEADTTIEVRFRNLIKRIVERTGKKVVVLIDEYDAPLLDVVHEHEELPQLRKMIRNFYAPLKGLDPYLRFVFMTGITKFSQLSIFSELNNIKNISMLNTYAGICGITKDELLTQMNIDIQMLAEANEMSYEQTVHKLTEKYDGYHFTAISPDIFNPYSLLNCFADCKFDSYWFESGTPTYLIEMMRKFGTLPSEIGPIESNADDFDAPTEHMNTIVPLLYQSGYLTIKSYTKALNSYVLDIPNEEVRIGLMKSLITHYISKPNEMNSVIIQIVRSFMDEDTDKAIRLLQAYFKTVPYCDVTNHEGHWQQLLYVVFSLLGGYGDVEVHTSTGRVDLAMVLFGKLYLIETKLNGSAKAAINQINQKDYTSRFALCNLPIIKIGINFDTKQRGITEWEIKC